MSFIKKTTKLLLPVVLLFCMCLQEKDSVIRQKLNVILKDDLEAILEDVAKEALLETPYFELLEYREYKEGAYSRLAVVDFYFLNSINMKITRKFRYHKKLGLWDRYYNKYYMFSPETEETNKTVETAD
ncbi:MAG: hypothetical protein FWE57_10275 [Chitinispirillia bacterium]|nr:hypothetical protein [Chitinispirillia bacterium]